MRNNHFQDNKAARREAKSRKKKYGMKESGRGVKLIERLQKERADKLKRISKSDSK
ncbi:MAG: hypothetical protein WC570_00440 [Patescibacteria group bacterium]